MPLKRTFIGKVTGHGLDDLWTKGQKAHSDFNLAKRYKNYQKHRYQRAKDKLLYKEREYSKAKSETDMARLQAAVGIGTSIGAGVATATYKDTKKKADPRRELEPVRIKFASGILPTITGKAIRTVKRQRAAAARLMKEYPEGNNLHELGNRAWDRSKDKLFKERLKTYSTWAGAGVTGKILTDQTKQANLRFTLGTTGIGAFSGAGSVLAQPELEKNFKNFGEGAAIGGAFGLGVGAATTAAFKHWDKIQKLRKKLMQKQAKIGYQSIERDLGKNFSKKKEHKINRMLGQERKKSFILQNRYLTGIPTLGIAPALAEKSVKNKVIKSLARD